MNARVTSQRKLLLGAAFVVLCAAAVLLVIELGAPAPPVVNGPRLVNALAQYTWDLRSRGAPTPPSVTLDTLLKSGYLTPADVKPFQGARVTFYLDASAAYPQSILMEADMPDGTVEAVLGDGSVQQFSKQKWEDALKNRGQDGAAHNQR